MVEAGRLSRTVRPLARRRFSPLGFRSNQHEWYGGSARLTLDITENKVSNKSTTRSKPAHPTAFPRKASLPKCTGVTILDHFSVDTVKGRNYAPRSRGYKPDKESVIVPSVCWHWTPAFVIAKGRRHI